jgi:transposase-like protein
VWCRIASACPTPAADDLDISDQTIYTWRRQDLIDSGQLPGLTSADNTELGAARRRIAELEAELTIHRRAAELLKDTSGPMGATRRSP